MSVDIQTGSRIGVGAPRAHFKLPLHPYSANFEISRDSERIPVLDNLDSNMLARTSVVVNWPSAISSKTAAPRP
jgi:hypothetical protein